MVASVDHESFILADAIAHRVHTGHHPQVSRLWHQQQTQSKHINLKTSLCAVQWPPVWCNVSKERHGSTVPYEVGNFANYKMDNFSLIFKTS